jgi:hypothetical protein
MVVTEQKGEDLDLSWYDLEYSELLSVEWRPEPREVYLKLRCPVVGWALKEKLTRFLRALGLRALVSDTCVEYIVRLTFLGVTEVVETLISQGHTVIGCDPGDNTWMQSFIFEIEDIRILKVRPDLFRFYLRSEGLHLDFNFANCIFREECVERE